MKLTTVKEIYKNREEYLNKEVSVGGWVRSVRGSKAFGFIVLHDGTFFETLQVVYHDNMPNFAEISKLNVGAAIIVKGTLVPTPEAKQPFEIQAEEVQVEGASAPDYPLQKKRHTLEYLRTMTHLRPRTNTFQAVFRVRSLCAYAIHKFFQELIQIFISIRSHICSCQRTVQPIQCLTVLPDNQVIHTFKLIINCSHRVSGIIGKFSRRQKIKSLVYKQLPCLDNQINSYFLFCLRHFNPSVIKFSSLP